jgi:glycosyltransferase involved in cell wall biosynthesis
MSPLEIVCVSHNAPPMNDAEALCTGRLLSALVQLGAKVHLVTGDGQPALDPSIVDEIFDPRIEVTTVLAPSGRFHRASSMIRYGYHGTHVEWMKPAILATQQVLAKLTKPILMTRACPWVSNFVGYYCRHLSAGWVAHFSDPFPPHEWQSHALSRFARPINRIWARRILKQADLVTVTCPNAIRYIEEKSGIPFRDKAMVVTHLAMPQIQPGNFKLERKPGEFVIAHIGTLFMRRRPDLLLNGAILAMEKHPEIRFLQYGHVDQGTLDLARSSPAFSRLEIRHIDNLSPRDAADLQAQVDVNVIVDTDLGLHYSPFSLSKFPHAACTGKPMLMLSTEDSEMARLTRLHGGGEFVPFSTPETVADAICRLYEGRNHHRLVKSRNPYHDYFSRGRIVQPLFQRIHVIS